MPVSALTFSCACWVKSSPGEEVSGGGAFPVPIPPFTHPPTGPVVIKEANKFHTDSFVE